MVISDIKLPMRAVKRPDMNQDTPMVRIMVILPVNSRAMRKASKTGMRKDIQEVMMQENNRDMTTDTRMVMKQDTRKDFQKDRLTVVRMVMNMVIPRV